MAITIQQVESMVKSAGIQGYITEGDEILYQIGGENEFMHLINLSENGEMFRMHAIKLINPQIVNQSAYKSLLSAYLLKKMYDYKFGVMEMDDDGEIRIGVEMPLEDNTLTEKQFQRIFAFLTQGIDQIITEIKHLLETGSIPAIRQGGGTDASAEMLWRMMLVAALENPEIAAKLLADPDFPQQLKDILISARAVSAPEKF